MGGRILAVADAYEVMITSRPYKRPVRPEAARRGLVRYAGQQFDPEIVRAFLGVAVGDLRKVMGPLGVLSEVPILATVPRAGALIEMAGRQTIGAVGAAAGTGAFVAAATLSPVQVASPSTPMTTPVAHGSAGALAKMHARSTLTVAPKVPTQPVTSTQANDDPPSSGVVNPNGSSTTGGDGATNVKAVTDSASAEEVQSSTKTSLHADIPIAGTGATEVSIPTSPGSAATNLATAASDVTSTAGHAADSDCIRRELGIGERCQGVG